MRETWKKRYSVWRKIILRELLLLLCAVGIGLVWGIYRSPLYLPTLSGNVYAISPTGGSIFMVLSKEANNSLVRIDYKGNLLNYAVTETNQAFENMVVLDDTIYAVLTTYDTGGSKQELVALSMERTAMPMEVLLDLSEMKGSSDITWTGTYRPLGEEPEEICLGGIDSAGNGYLLHWDLDSEQTSLEQILPGEVLYKLKYVDDDHYVWINDQGQLGQYVDGVYQRDLFKTTEDDTPFHISTYERRILVSDSRSGNIYELSPGGDTPLLWSGTESIRNTAYQYQDITIFTSYMDDNDQIQVIALCNDGTSNVVISPSGVIKELHMGANIIWMVIGHSWTIMLLCFILLTLLAEIVRAALHSPRMAVRLAMCELMMAGVMLSAVLGIQYRFYQDTIQEDALQKLQLLGGNLADVLSIDDYEMSNEEVEKTAKEVVERVQNSHQYTVNVIWLSEEGVPVIGYDQTIPANYAVEDVKSRDYYASINSFLSGKDKYGLREIRNALNVNDFVYIQRIRQAKTGTQGYWEGCVTVSQGLKFKGKSYNISKTLEDDADNGTINKKAISYQPSYSNDIIQGKFELDEGILSANPGYFQIKDDGVRPPFEFSKKNRVYPSSMKSKSDIDHIISYSAISSILKWLINDFLGNKFNRTATVPIHHSNVSDAADAAAMRKDLNKLVHAIIPPKNHYFNFLFHFGLVPQKKKQFDKIHRDQLRLADTKVSEITNGIDSALPLTKQIVISQISLCNELLSILNSSVYNLRLGFNSVNRGIRANLDPIYKSETIIPAFHNSTKAIIYCNNNAHGGLMSQRLNRLLRLVYSKELLQKTNLAPYVGYKVASSDYHRKHTGLSENFGDYKPYYLIVIHTKTLATPASYILVHVCFMGSAESALSYQQFRIDTGATCTQTAYLGNAKMFVNAIRIKKLYDDLLSAKHPLITMPKTSSRFVKTSMVRAYSHYPSLPHFKSKHKKAKKSLRRWFSKNPGQPPAKKRHT